MPSSKHRSCYTKADSDKKPLLHHSHYCTESEHSESEDEEIVNDRKALAELREAIKERELAERRLEKKIRDKMGRLKTECLLEEQLNDWGRERERLNHK